MFNAPGYKTLREDRDSSTAFWGVAIIIKNNISFSENIIFDKPTDIEVRSIRLNSSSSTIITAVYKLPN